MMDTPLEANELDNAEIAYSFECATTELSKKLCVKPADLTIISQNIRSIYKNLADLQSNVTLLKFEPDVIVLTECRLTQHKPIPCLQNYNSFATTIHLNQNDGVTTYVKNTHRTIFKEINLTHASCLQINIYNTIILCIYRSPSNHCAERFINSLNTYLESIKSFETIVIVGDININTLPRTSEICQERNNRLNYLNMLSMHGLLPGHNLPTRIDSCLDHVMLKMNKTKNSAVVAVLQTSITDHLMVLLSLSKTSYKNSIKSKIVINYDNALKSLNKESLISLLTLNDPNILCQKVIAIVQKCLIDNTITQRIPRSKQIIKPWITQGILRCILNRNNMQKKLRNDPYNEILKITYKRYRNYCNNLIKKLKRKYDREQLSKASKNSKILWKTINNITNYKSTKTPNIQLLNAKASPKESVNFANSFFSNVGKSLAESISVQNLTNNSSPISSQSSSFVLLETDPTELYNIIMNLKSDSAPGWDNIPTKFLKLSVHVIVPALCHLANLCFDKGIFPDLLKQSIVTPVYKSGEREDINNYRPISVLPSISKIMEKLINNRLLKYLNKFSILSSSQYGFRQGVSTEDAVAAISNLIVEHVDNGKKCLAAFLDLKKAFDTVSVEILINKLEKVGVRGMSLQLLRDYLSNRKQRVKIGDFASDDESISYGVPQGSVLGPTLFLIYINDLCNAKIKNAKVFCYADDTAIVFSGISWNDVKIGAEEGLFQVSTWLRQNLLTLNVSKTNFMTFTKYNSSQPNNVFSLKLHKCNSVNSFCDCPNINKVDNTKYLGVIIDQRLSWHHHIELLMSRIRKTIWIFKILRHVASRELINQIYTSLAQSIQNYCIPIWGGATKTKLLELERAQRSLLKVMYFKPYQYPTDLLYRESGLLTVRKLYIQSAVLKVHKSLEYKPELLNKRRREKVATVVSTQSQFAARQYAKQSAYLYNSINKILNIYPMNYYTCKKTLTEWLLKLNYEQTEKLLEIVS